MTMLLSACSGRYHVYECDTVQPLQQDSIQLGNDISADAMIWADSIIETMTIEEMAGQLIMPAVYADNSQISIRLVREYASDAHIGGIVLLKGNKEAATAIVDTLRNLLSVPPFIAIDAEWGLAMRIEGYPEFPRNGRISEDAEESLLFDYGYEVARECHEIGVNMILGPVLDVVPAGGRGSAIGSRSFGSDPERAARLGVAYAKGVEAAGVISVAKHFPGHGSADADSHKKLPVVDKTLEQMEATDLRPFKEYINNGMSAIMTGHLYVPALDDMKVPVTVSEKILQKFIREELGFNGLIVTDAINMAGAGGRSAKEAVLAGADIVLAPANTIDELRGLIDFVRHGVLPVDILKDRVRRVLFFKYMAARFDTKISKTHERNEAERIIKLLR